MLSMVEHFTATSPSSSFRSLGGRLFEKWDSSGQILFFIRFRPTFQFYSWWAGLGVVIRNAQEVGRVIPHLLLRTAEAEAILCGFELSHRLNLRKIYIESDSQEWITNLKNQKYSGDWTIYPLIRMIRKKQSEFSEVHWNWVPREANSAAASLADREVGLQCWVDRPPPSLLRVLTADGLPGPPTHLGLSFDFCLLSFSFPFGVFSLSYLVCIGTVQ